MSPFLEPLAPSLARSGALVPRIDHVHIHKPLRYLTLFSLPLSSGFSVMSDRVFRTDELAARIATHLQAISRKGTVSLALTCGALEVPALRALWEARPRVELSRIIMRLLSDDTWCSIFPRDNDLCLLVGLLLSSGVIPHTHQP